MKQQDNVVLGRSRANPVPNRICIFDEAFSWPPRAKEEEPSRNWDSRLKSTQNRARTSQEKAMKSPLFYYRNLGTHQLKPS